MKVFFIQSGFVNEGGHYLLETRAWRHAITTQQLEWHGYANAALDRQLAAIEQVTPLFPYPTPQLIDPDPLSRPITDLLYLSEQFASAAALIPDVSAHDLVIVEFATAHEIYALARWLRTLSLQQRPRVALLVHGPDPEWSYQRHSDTFAGAVTTWRFAINQLNGVLPPQRIYLAAIDTRLAKMLSTILDRPVGVTPLVSVFDGAALSSAGDKRFDLMFAGDLRLEKGAPLLLQILEGLEGQRREAPVRIALQLGTADDAQQTRTKFARASNITLDIVAGPLQPQDYIARLTQSRIAVLPYVASAYAMRGSGIAAEAFGYGIPVVAPADSWMSDRLADGSGAGVTFSSFDAASVIAAAQTALAQYQQLIITARSAAPRWREQNSATVALNRIRDTLSI